MSIRCPTILVAPPPGLEAKIRPPPPLLTVTVLAAPSEVTTAQLTMVTLFGITAPEVPAAYVNATDAAVPLASSNPDQPKPNVVVVALLLNRVVFPACTKETIAPGAPHPSPFLISPKYTHPFTPKLLLREVKFDGIGNTVSATITKS